VGETITVTAALNASSTAGTVVEMQLGARLAGGCLGEDELEGFPIEPFSPTRDIPVEIGFTNWVGYAVSARFYDDVGNTSPIFCDDISIEGMPAAP
jgi:hypothetical protein